MRTLFISIITMAAMLSCSKNEVNFEPTISTEFTEGIVATVEDFRTETKTAITNQLKFSWAEGDVIGVVPMDNKTFQTNYEIKAIGSNPKEASFDGGAWALKEGNQYAAYYPCKSIVLTSSGSAEILFTGQEQSGNDNTQNLGAYDYMYASAVSPADGSATFAFKHKVSILRVSVPVQYTAEYTNLTLSCNAAVFATKASLSIADGSTVATTKSKTISVSLDNISVNSGENLVVWLSVLPTADVNGKTFTATIKDSNNFISEFSFSTAVEAFEAGKAYQFNQAQQKVLFNDTFDWVKTFIPDTGCADFVNGTYDSIQARIDDSNSNSRSINLHNTYPDTFPKALSDAGYFDKMSGNKVIYAQGTKTNPYLKFCKGNTQTAISLQPFKESYGCVTIRLDWAVHMTTSVLDASDLQLRIEGDGQFSNGTKISDPFTLSQTSAQEVPVWSHAVAEINYVTKNTKIVISTKQGFESENFNASGQHRFYLDNLNISSGKPSL